MKIKLNFLSLSNSKFNFNVFCKKYENTGTKEENTFVHRLPDEKNEYQRYVISFVEKEGFNEREVNSFDNYELTKKFLFTRWALVKDFPYITKILNKGFKQEFIIEISTNKKGKQCIVLIPYYLFEKEQFGFLIDFKFHKKQDVPYDSEVQFLSLSLDKQNRSNKNYYTDKFRIINKVIPYVTESYIIKNSSEDIKLISEFITLQSERLLVKSYLLSKNNISNSQFMGIKVYGPFKELNTKINFLFVFEDKLRIFANDVYDGLFGKLSPGTFPGFKKMFNIDFSKNNVIRIPFISNSKEEIDNAIKIISSKNDSKSIVIFIESDNKEDNLTSQNYYYFKYQLSKRKIPLQVISYKNLGRSNRLKWSISNIALQIFSKMGGIPWIVKSQNDSLILGIGSAHKIREGKVQKYFAYTVCLDSSGLYKKVEILSSSNEESNYLEILKNNLISLLKSEDYSIYKKCALHIPFKIKNKEVQAISNAINEIDQIEFVVIKVNTENKFFGFAPNNTMVPYESSFVKLNKYQFLVWFEGLQYGKELVNKRTANPVHIQFLKMPNSTNYKDYLQDIINLSGANWRGFNSKAIPVSIYYSKIIADYTSYFEYYDDFDNTEISNIKPWFL